MRFKSALVLIVALATMLAVLLSLSTTDQASAKRGGQFITKALKPNKQLPLPPYAGSPYWAHDFSSKGRVIDVGDSHTWLSGAGAAYPGWDVDALPGRASADGLWILDRYMMPRHKEVVFDLATNDRANPSLYAQNLRTLWGMLGPNRELTLVTSYVTPPGASPAGVNAVIDRFASAHPQRVVVVDFGAYSATRPHLYSADTVHLTAAGYAQRVQMVKKGVQMTPQKLRGKVKYKKVLRPVPLKAQKR